MNKVFTSLLLILILTSCESPDRDYEVVFKNPQLYSQLEGTLTEVITHDVFSPPVASRIYAYANLAAYEVMSTGSLEYNSLSSVLKGFEPIPLPKSPINIELASILAFANIGQALTFSKDSTQNIIDSFLELAEKNGMPSEMIVNSSSYAEDVSSRVLKWAEKDNYKETRSDVKYAVSTDEGRWVPTPPAYMQAIEPNWMKIRPVMLDSASQFLPKPPTDFSRKKDSDFYNLALELYDKGNNLTDGQKAMADFWDCNSYKLHTMGHMMFATKALTPGGHWLGIVGIISNNKNADFEKTVFAYTSVSFAIMDAFIACWETKFHFNLVRPETFINSYIDNAWEPYLQTPPFPEYTSGHSIISNASATVLTRIFGEDTAFIDSLERRWGWPDRPFENVKEAAYEAAESRIYGGIHYREAVEVGLIEGEKVGNLVFDKMQTVINRPKEQDL